MLRNPNTQVCQIKKKGKKRENFFIDSSCPEIIVCTANVHDPTLSPIQQHSPHLSRRLSISNAATLVRQSLGASDLLEAHVRVISILKPVEPPIAPWLELLGEAVTSRALGDATVLLTPALRWCTPLVCTRVEETYSATYTMVSVLNWGVWEGGLRTWHRDVEVVLTEITASVGGLHNHLLATDRAGCESQPEVAILVLCFVNGIGEKLTRSRHSTKRFRSN
jgi:hypothetical protein